MVSRRVMQAMKQVGDMKKFAEATGGAVLSAEKLKGVEGAFREFMRQMTSQYYLGYFSSNPKRDGGLRNIEVKLSRNGKLQLGNLKIQHRRAYVAPGLDGDHEMHEMHEIHEIQEKMKAEPT